jgi:F-type H+-transporting ATPase subunit gamma
MTRRRKLEQHRHSLEEIRDIMNSMKTLAYMETRKLARFLDAQRDVVQSIEDMAADLLSFYPETLPEIQNSTAVYLLLGSERGFCGDFNHALLRHLELTLQEQTTENPILLAIGRKLSMLLEGDNRVSVFLDGAGVVEESTTLLNQLVRELTALQEKHGVLSVYCLYHGGEDGIVTQKLLPPFYELMHRPQRFSHPPVLNLEPAEFLIELTDQYLFAVLFELLYTSLMVENHNRVAHLDGAVKHLDDESSDLTRQSNAMRQEEIIEEIEVILLSASSLGEKHEKPDRDKLPFSPRTKSP